jgi:hypothetical protein
MMKMNYGKVRRHRSEKKQGEKKRRNEKEED